MTDSAALTRRGVLATGCALGGAAVLAACGSSASSPSSASATEAPSSGAGGGGEALATVASIPVGGGAVFEGPKVVVTRPQEGTVKGFSAVCPHQGCLVSEVVDNEILCPCHGSLFSAEDGAVIQGPATTGLAPASVSVSGDQVILG